MKVYELLDKPEKWIQGELAKNAKGETTLPTSQDAVCYCLMGALMKCYGNKSSIIPIEAKVRKALGEDQFHGGSYVNWNDDPQRKYEEVLALVKELDL